MMPRSPMPAMTSSPFTLSVKVMVALRVWGLASLPIESSPCSMIHSVVSSRSASFEKLSLPSMESPPSAGGLTSSTTCLSFAMTTFSPATGTLAFGHVAGSDQSDWPADCALPSWAAHTLTTRNAGRSEARKKERCRALMESTPALGIMILNLGCRRNGGPTPSEKPPAEGRGLLLMTARRSLTADLDGGCVTRGAGAGVTVGDHLHPERILVLEVRGLAGRAQRIQAALRRTRGCRCESRQLEDQPGAFVQLRQGEVHLRPLRGDLDLGTGSHVGGAGYGELLAKSAENDRRLSGCSTAEPAAAAGTGRCAGARRAARSTTTAHGSAARCAGAARYRRAARCAGAACSRSAARTARTAATAAEATTAEAAEPAATAAEAQASDVAAAHGGVPGGLDLTGLCIDCDAV